ncbi:hypothetical protein COB11_01850 [Candidatus Aerophobetes bacterium]|uniref:Lipoprotein n=1 Tax=Aerophobetes bacterium TaxID=2030807 RepID=A0A2A4YL57_UNCAE|nr:MAG: hypothetical protein COB11_01850 [Candidatus Aerophobetes bacterium]
MKVFTKTLLIIPLLGCVCFFTSCSREDQGVLKESENKNSKHQRNEKLEAFYDAIDQDDHIQSLDGTYDSKTFEPIELRIENQTNHAVLIREDSFNFKIASISEIYPEYSEGFFFPYDKSLISECLSGKIPANSKVNGVIFVRKGDFRSDFTIKLYDEKLDEGMIVQAKATIERLH